MGFGIQGFGLQLFGALSAYAFKVIEVVGRCGAFHVGPHGAGVSDCRGVGI